MASAPLRKLTRGTALAALGALCAVALSTPREAGAATQGERGHTSTARVKITLRIPPRGEEVAHQLAAARTGSEALDGFCAAGSFERPESVFRAQLPADGTGEAALLEAACGDGAAATGERRPRHSERTTVRISPL